MGLLDHGQGRNGEAAMSSLDLNVIRLRAELLSEVGSNIGTTGGNFLGTFTVSNLPIAPITGSNAYASNARKIGEGAGAGTGVPVYYHTVWRTLSSDQPVQA